MTNSNPAPSGPFSSRGFIAAAIVIGVIVLAGVIVAVTALTAPKGEPSGVASAPDSTPAPSGTESVCGLKGYEEVSTLTEAPDNKWELVGTMAAPALGSAAGPGLDDDGLRYCYARTAEGALYAAVGYIAASTDISNQPRLYELFAEGAVRDALEKSNHAGPLSDDRMQVAGFRVINYTPDEATVEVAWRVTTAGSRLVAFPMVLRWESGDWKLYFSEGGSGFAFRAIQSLGGFIPWAGV